MKRAVTFFVSIVLLCSTGAIGLLVYDITQSYNSERNFSDARHVQRMSAALASLGITHILGGDESDIIAAIAVLKEGVIIQDGPMKDEMFQLPNISVSRQKDVAKLLRHQLDMREARLVLKFEFPVVYNSISSRIGKKLFSL